MSQCILAFSWSPGQELAGRNRQTTVVVLAPKIQPGPHQVFGTVNGTDVFRPFCHPPLKPGPYLQLHVGMLEQRG